MWGVRVSRVKPSNCFRRLEKLVLTSIFDTVVHPSWCETCGVIRQQFGMKECDILGGRNMLWPLLHIFRGSGPPNPMIYAPDRLESCVASRRVASRRVVTRSPVVCCCCLLARETGSSLLVAPGVHVMIWSSRAGSFADRCQRSLRTHTHSHCLAPWRYN